VLTGNALAGAVIGGALTGALGGVVGSGANYLANGAAGKGWDASQLGSQMLTSALVGAAGGAVLSGASYGLSSSFRNQVATNISNFRMNHPTMTNALEGIDFKFGGMKQSVQNPAMCFAAGTFVQTVQGLIPIENIAKGDTVFTYDFSRKSVDQKIVLATHQSKTKIWVNVVIGESDTLKATRFHPFWDPENSVWRHAVDLKAGFKVQNKKGQAVFVNSVWFDTLLSFCKTYNLTIDEDHNYLVGHAGVLVHNGPEANHPLILGTELSEKSAEESFKIITYGQAKAAENLNLPGVRIDIPKGNFNAPGNFPHAHGKGWMINIDGTLHDEGKNYLRVPEDIKMKLRSVGWGC
jgi:hypothetical protein